ncbi:hypothetical protein CFI11_02595 [Thalassococcus sp. S3]|nr:hypothetical protein CFI11_02595 [Thalassococcus sp. S3]
MLLAARSCVQKQDYDKALRLFLLMQLRAYYDTTRVADRTAHQAQFALSLMFSDGLTTRTRGRFEKAFKRFGDSGSPAHIEFCRSVTKGGPPSYFPSYMIQHGMKAFTSPRSDGLVRGHNPRLAWQKTLRNYMKC